MLQLGRRNINCLWVAVCLAKSWSISIPYGLASLCGNNVLTFPTKSYQHVDVALAETTGKYASVWEKICSRHYLDALITRCPFYPSLWFPYKSKRSMFRLRLWINSDSKCSKMGICISFVAYPAKIGIYFHEGLLWHARYSQMNFHLESSLPRCLRKHLGQGVSMYRVGRLNCPPRPFGSIWFTILTYKLKKLSLYLPLGSVRGLK